MDGDSPFSAGPAQRSRINRVRAVIRSMCRLFLTTCGGRWASTSDVWRGVPGIALHPSRNSVSRALDEMHQAGEVDRRDGASRRVEWRLCRGR